MINPDLYLNFEESGWTEALSDIEKLSETVTQAAFAYAEKHHDLSLLDLNKPVIIGLTLSNDTSVHALNKEFRGIDKPTNVLSFANIDDPDFKTDCRIFEEIELGDIIIALETMQHEAKEKGISLKDHYCHLLTHGILHLLGFDHQNDDEAEYMENFEINILQQLNISNPYTE